MDGLKKRLCNPPAVEVSRSGDPEVCGLFVGAGDGLAYALEEPDVKSRVSACRAFEKEVVACEHDYVVARQKLATETASRLQAAVARFAAATGGDSGTAPRPAT